MNRIPENTWVYLKDIDCDFAFEGKYDIYAKHWNWETDKFESTRFIDCSYHKHNKFWIASDGKDFTVKGVKPYAIMKVSLPEIK